MSDVRKLNISMGISEKWAVMVLGQAQFTLESSLEEDQFVREIGKRSIQFAKGLIERMEKELVEEYGENWRDL